MSTVVYDVNNTLVQLTMVLKLQQLKRDELPSLSYENLEDFLTEKLWAVRLPSTLHEAADDILNVQANEIVRWLSKRAIIDGSRTQLEDFSDVIGG